MADHQENPSTTSSMVGSTNLPVLQPVASADDGGASSFGAEVDAAGQKALAEMEQRVAAKWVGFPLDLKCGG